jgi:hypothetical protein
MEQLMDDSLISYIEKRLMQDIANAKDFYAAQDRVDSRIVRYPEDVIDPRSAPPSCEAPSCEARRAGDHQINLIVEQLTLALGSSGEPRQTHLRTARVLLAMIAPRD